MLIDVYKKSINITEINSKFSSFQEFITHMKSNINSNTLLIKNKNEYIISIELNQDSFSFDLFKNKLNFDIIAVNLNREILKMTNDIKNLEINKENILQENKSIKEEYEKLKNINIELSKKIDSLENIKNDLRKEINKLNEDIKNINKKEELKKLEEKKSLKFSKSNNQIVKTKPISYITYNPNLKKKKDDFENDIDKENINIKDSMLSIYNSDIDDNSLDKIANILLINKKILLKRDEWQNRRYKQKNIKKNKNNFFKKNDKYKAIIHKNISLEKIRKSNDWGNINNITIYNNILNNKENNINQKNKIIEVENTKIINIDSLNDNQSNYNFFYEENKDINKNNLINTINNKNINYDLLNPLVTKRFDLTCKNNELNKAMEQRIKKTFSLENDFANLYANPNIKNNNLIYHKKNIKKINEEENNISPINNNCRYRNSLGINFYKHNLILTEKKIKVKRGFYNEYKN